MVDSGVCGFGRGGCAAIAFSAAVRGEARGAPVGLMGGWFVLGPWAPGWNVLSPANAMDRATVRGRIPGAVVGSLRSTSGLTRMLARGTSITPQIMTFAIDPDNRSRQSIQTTAYPLAACPLALCCPDFGTRIALPALGNLSVITDNSQNYIQDSLYKDS